MRILLVASWYPSPDRPMRGIFFREQAEALARRGHEVVVLVTERRATKKRASWMVAPGKPGVAGFRVAMENGIAVYRSAKRWWFLPAMKYLRYPPLLQLRLLRRDARRACNRIVRESGGFDIIHAHSAYWGGAVARGIARAQGLPFVVTEHRSNFLSCLFPRGVLKELAEAFRSAARVIAVSDPLHMVLVGKFGCPASISVTIPNMVSQRFFVVKRSIMKRPYRYIAVGGIIERKRQADILRAFAAVSESTPDIELRLIGEGPLADHCRQIASELGIDARVRFMGALSPDRVAGEMAECDALVLASRHETFGVVVAEALATGIPVVATRCGGPETIIDASNGILVPVDDSTALAEGMLLLQRNRASYDARLIREAASFKYGEASVIAAIEDLYIAVLGTAARNGQRRLAIPARD